MCKGPNTWSKYGQQFFLLSILLFLGIFFSLSIGRYSQNPTDVLQVLLRQVGLSAEMDPKMHTIVMNIRMPRVLATIFIGSMLSLSGAVYQAIFKNPLVSPDLLGVSSGASVGAALSILLGLGLGTRQLLAFVGGLLAVRLTTLLPKLLQRSSNMMLVLSGIIVGGFLNALLAIMKYIAEEQTELSSIVYWQMGSVARVSFFDLLSILPIFVLASLVLILLSWRLNILSFSEIEARTLGINTQRYRGIVIICASLLTASAVSISGTIGWIGLVIPHLARIVVGTDNTKMLPFTMLLGGFFMLIVDTLSRTISSVEIPLSILTGFIGAPVFALLLYKQRTRIE